MSDMLEQAIIDAETLKEAALKNAEKIIVEKYSNEIKEAVDTLLEQPVEEDPLDAVEEAPLGAEDDLLGIEEGSEENVPDLPRADLDGEDIEGVETSSEGKSVEINLGELAQALEEDEESGEGVNVEDLINREQEVAPEMPETSEETGEGEEIELSEEQISEILEKLTIDIKNVPTGQAGGASNETLEKEIKDILEAEEEEEGLNEDEESPLPSAREKELGKQVENLSLKNKKLMKEKKKFKDMLLQLKDRLEEVNLSNAKLLYTNRVLGSASLNERQRNRIVDALSNADSVEEAKVIYETLQSAVGVSRKRTPKSLSEAVQRSSTTLPRRNSETKKLDPVKNRWKTLAGIS